MQPVLTGRPVLGVVLKGYPRISETFQRQRLIDYIPWDALTPERMRDKVDAIIADSQPLRDAIARFPLTGIEAMRQRLKEFRCGRC